jgi:hypothetical protein
MKTPRQIAKEQIEGWCYSQPTNIEALLALVDTTKSWGNGWMDKAMEVGCSAGLAALIAKKVKEEAAAQRITTSTRAERIDRFLSQTWITK